MVNETVASYDEHPEAFVARTRDRGRVAPAAARFGELLHDGATVLDVGCGPGFDGPLLRAHGLRVIHTDLSAALLRIGRDEWPGPRVRADMRALPFARCADGVWANASFLHIEPDDVPATLAGFRRVLVPGGLLFLSLKRGDGTRWVDGPAEGERRRFTFWQPDDLDAVLRDSGYTIVDGYERKATKNEWIVRYLRAPQA